MKRTYVIFLFAAFSACAGDLDVRHLYITNDVSSAKPAVSPIRWYEGESVKMDLYVRRGVAPVDLSATGLYARWEGFLATNNTLAYLMKTGTIANATNGYITFDLEPSDANLPTNTYKSFVKIYQQAGSTNRYVGAALASDIHVLWGPNASNITYMGPYTNSAESDPVWAVDKISITSSITGLSTTQALHTAAISGLQSTQATILATTGTNGSASLIYVDGAVSNWSYYVAKSDVNMAGRAITNITTASMETNVVDVIYRKNGYKLMDSSALYWDNPLTGYSVVFDSGALVSPSSGTSLDWQKYHLTNGEWKVSNAANEGHEIVNWNVLTGTKISSSTNSDTANVASNVTEGVTNAIISLASNSFAHGSLTMGYLVSSNNTNEIVWFGDFQRPLTITNLGWFSTVGSATGIVFLADNATAPSAWDSICYTGLAFAAQVRSNDAVSISVTAGQRIGFMASECTNATLFVGW